MSINHQHPLLFSYTAAPVTGRSIERILQIGMRHFHTQDYDRSTQLEHVRGRVFRNGADEGLKLLTTIARISQFNIAVSGLSRVRLVQSACRRRLVFRLCRQFSQCRAPGQCFPKAGRASFRPR